MHDASLSQLEAAISRPEHLPRSGGRLAIAEKPEPFVAPTLRLASSSSGNPFAAEVVFVQASAAVGKSVMAKYLSASSQVPLLNLAAVPVSTHSLVGLIQSDVSGDGDPVKAFHAGSLPLIIDALDEGRLLSGEHGFEGFLETTGELLLRDRSVVNRPKLILFGRHESTELATLGLQMSGPGITTRSVEVGFFDEEAAWNLIDAYATSSAKPSTAYNTHPEPVRDLIEAYFTAIEAALGLGHGALWSDDRGRAFAGYAPVLAALGSLLAELDNFGVVANRLRSGNSREAWNVIETVLKEILDREKEKLGEKLAQHVQVHVPPQAYDADEQLTFLTRFVHRQRIADTGRVNLPQADKVKYFSMVEQYIPEHPFIRQGTLGNAVLGSRVLAHAVAHDLLKDSSLSFLEDLSRQPFVWRSLVGSLASPDALIDGRYLGCVLDSFWSDPITRHPDVFIRSSGDGGSAIVRIPASGEGEVAFEITLPLTLYGQAQNCDLKVDDTVTLRGHAPRDSASTFYVHGSSVFICNTLQITADTIALDGNIWFEADQVSAPARLNLRPKNEAEVGCAGGLVQQYPFNQLSTTLAPPYVIDSEDDLTRLVDECRARLPGGGGVLTLNTDLSAPDDDRRMRWVVRQFPHAFPRLITLMIDHNLASTDAMDASGSRPKTRVRFHTTWDALHDALHARTQDDRLRRFIAEARRALSE